MKKRIVKNKIFVISLIFVIICTVFFNLVSGGAFALSTDTAADNGNTKEVAQKMESVYEIYPTPHGIEYGDNSVKVTDDVKVDFGADVDGVTKTHLYDALSRLDVVATPSAEANCTRVLVGIHGSGDEADKFIDSKLSLDASFFDKIDAHVIFIGDNTVAVVGKDTDAAFYGITTLDLIFGQVKNQTVRELTVTDYSDSVYRGFIEGYYGVPWTTDERIELMRFGSRFKSNIYIYAPKDDPYHSSNWRGLYKAGDLLALKEQIKAGAETKTLFTWAIHPFMENSQPFRRATFDADLDDLLAKLQQVYDAGVRQFMVSADDIMESNMDAECHKDLLNAVQAWLEEKGDCGNLIFVGTAYSGFYGPMCETYYSGLMNGLDERIVIMWTGAGITSRLSNCAYDTFDELTGGRQPFIWMNWPVSDYCTSNVLLGAGEVFDVKAADGDLPFSGVVVNPMQHAEMSKISLFATADYCWNVNGFDTFKNYEDCFKYIDDGEPQALRNIAVHLANPNGEFDGGWFTESVELNKYIQRYKSAYASGDYVQAAIDLSNQLEIIVSASEIYEAGATNIALKDSIRPWSEGLKRTAVAAQQYLELAVQIKDGVKEEHKDLYYQAKATLESVKECLCPVLGPAWQGSIVYNPVVVGPKVLTPFVNELADEMTERIAVSLGIYTGITVKGFPELWRGTLAESITDGNPDTYAHFAGAPADGAFIRVDLGEITEITKLRLVNGTPAVDNFAAGDDAIVGYIDYSADGVVYTKLCDIAGVDTLVNLSGSKAVSARYIRIVSEGTRHYAAVRELYVNSFGGYNGAIVSSYNFGTCQMNTSLYDMLDGNPDTFAWFDYPTKDGDEEPYVEIDYLEVKQISALNILVGKPDGGDGFGGRVKYSIDGETWTEIGQTLQNNSLSCEFDTPISARYIRIFSDAPQTWQAIREVVIN